MILAQTNQLAPGSPNAGELPDIQDIIAPEALTNYWILIFGILVSLLFIGGLVWLLLYFLRKDQGRSRQIPAGRVAMQKLEELERQANTLPANEFSLEVSNILKDYLKDRFHDSFRYETSEEFLTRMSSALSNPLPQRLRAALADFVGLCDELKFSRPANADAGKLPLLEEARRIVREPTHSDAEPVAG